MQYGNNNKATFYSVFVHFTVKKKNVQEIQLPYRYILKHISKQNYTEHIITINTRKNEKYANKEFPNIASKMCSQGRKVELKVCIKLPQT